LAETRAVLSVVPVQFSCSRVSPILRALVQMRLHTYAVLVTLAVMNQTESCDRFIERLRSRVILHGVTDFDLLAYKFRVENGVYGDELHGTPPHESFVTLKRLEHLFESVAIHLPVGRRMWWQRRRRRRTAAGDRGRGGLTFGSALCRVAVATAATWCDDCASTVHAVVRYFGGSSAGELFDARRHTDSAIERRVLATVPYVRSLRLVDDRFHLASPSSILDSRLRQKITAVDERLTAGGGLAVAAGRSAELTGAYRTVREICVDVGLVRREDPELPEHPEAASAGDVVVLVRHLVRLACGTTAAARRTELDRRFTELVARLHDTLVNSVDDRTLRAVERTRDGTPAPLANKPAVNDLIRCKNNQSINQSPEFL